MELTKELKEVVRGNVNADPKTLAKFSRDASLFSVKPQVVVAPKDVADIKALVNFVNWNKSLKLSLTARSGGTDMTGGPLNTSIIVDMARHMNTPSRLFPDRAIVQPGLYYRDFERETLKHGLLLPSYPASREICTVGGMVANNSGGEKTLTYGQTERYVAALKAVLRDGNEYSFGPLDREGLDEKMNLQTLEGQVYRDIFKLVEENYERIKNAKPDVSKNSSGYFLWNVWDKHTFDMSKLFTGSQGTLGIMTEITFNLIKPKKHSKLLVIFMKELKPLAQVINSVLQHRPESFEAYDDQTLKLTLRFLPQFVKLIGARNIFSLAWQFLPEFGLILAGGFPKLVLLAEFTGHTEAEVDRKISFAKHDLKLFKIRTRTTRTEAEAKKYWTIRRESFNLLRQRIKGKRTAPFIDDVIVRPERLPDFLPELKKLMEPYKDNLFYTIAGHAGDGNFHVIPLVTAGDPKLKKIIPELSRKVYDLVLKFGGSITGEHNDGLIRSPFLKQMYGEEVYMLFEKVKAVFDPDNIFNPGKKVGASFDYSAAHLNTD